jgi:hypothetical protein
MCEGLLLSSESGHVRSALVDAQRRETSAGGLCASASALAPAQRAGRSLCSYVQR